MKRLALTPLFGIFGLLGYTGAAAGCALDATRDSAEDPQESTGSTSAELRNCNPALDCDPRPPPPPPPPPKKGVAFPSYYVLTLLYDAPGIGSQVAYGAQSTIGSEVDVQNLFKYGVQFSAQGTIFGIGTTVQGGFAIGPVNGNSWETSTTNGTTVSLTSEQDGLSHAYDTFFLWTNAEIDMSQTGTNPVVTTLTSRGGAAPIIVPVTVAELQNPALLPGWKQPLLAALKPADYASILTLDPLVPHSVISIFGEPRPDPARYDYVTTLPLDGPDHPGDPVDGFGVAVTHEATNGTSSGYNTATTASIMFQTGFNLFGLLGAGIQAGGTFEWDYQKITQNKNGTSQTATVTLQTTTVGYHDVLLVYFDTLFNSFAFVHPPPVFQQAPVQALQD